MKEGFSTGNFVLDQALESLLGPNGEADLEDLGAKAKTVGGCVDQNKFALWFSQQNFIQGPPAGAQEAMKEFLEAFSKLTTDVNL